MRGATAKIWSNLRYETQIGVGERGVRFNLLFCFLSVCPMLHISRVYESGETEWCFLDRKIDCYRALEIPDRSAA